MLLLLLVLLLLVLLVLLPLLPLLLLLRQSGIIKPNYAHQLKNLHYRQAPVRHERGVACVPRVDVISGSWSCVGCYWPWLW